MVVIEGKAGIKVKILADSINKAGNRLITYELTYPRIIHSELLTHGMLVRNAASSRAIPFAKMVEQLTARPVRFGQANPGMQDKGVDFDGPVDVLCEDSDGEYWLSCNPEAAWAIAKDNAIQLSEAFYKAGYHKQVYNRLTEPFQMMKTVLSGTEFNNFFWLRNHDAADPTLAELARCMYEVREKSKPIVLNPGEWHLPYVENYQEIIGEEGDDVYGPMEYFIGNIGDDTFQPLTIEQAIKVSAARCAAVSFRNEDYGLQKCLEVYDRLVGDKRKHASAFQHQATPVQFRNNGIEGQFSVIGRINCSEETRTWEKGISHVDREGNLWSAQFKGWIMNRKLIPGENYTG